MTSSCFIASYHINWLKSWAFYLQILQFIPGIIIFEPRATMTYHSACNWADMYLHTSTWTNGQHFAGDIFKCIFMTQNIYIYWYRLWFRPWLDTEYRQQAWVGVTKPISSVPLISRFFTIVKTLVTYWTSCSYLTGVAAAQLRWHMSNMNVMQII